MEAASIHIPGNKTKEQGSQVVEAGPGIHSEVLGGMQRVRRNGHSLPSSKPLNVLDFFSITVSLEITFKAQGPFPRKICVGHTKFCIVFLESLRPLGALKLAKDIKVIKRD